MSVDGGAVVVVSGPPGAGKSTVAGLVADRAARSVLLRSDEFYASVRQGFVEPWRPEADAQNTTVVTAYAAAASRFAAGGYLVVVDAVLGPWLLETFREALDLASSPVHYVVLRPGESEAVRRATGREGEALRDPDVVRDLHRQFADLGPLEPHAIDTSELTAQESADAVWQALGEGRLAL